MPVQGGGNGQGSLNSGLLVRFSGITKNPACPSVISRLARPVEYYNIVPNIGTDVVYQGGNIWAIQKLSGGSAYNADAVGTVGFAGDFLVQVPLATAFNGNWFFGMATAPLTDGSFTSMEYSLLSDNSSWTVFESGTQIGSGVTNATYGWIWRSGTTLNYGTGATFAIASTTGLIRSVAGVTATLFFDSSFHDDGTVVSVYLTDTIPVTTAYSLTADAGVFTFTGQPTNLLLGFNMAAGLGSFSLVGQAVNLMRGYIMAAGQATFNYSGQAAALTRGYSMPAGQAAFTYSGQTVNLQQLASMTAGLGTFSLAGQAALLERGYSMPAGQASYVYTGQPVNLLRGYVMPAGLGTYSLAGQAVVFGITATLPASPGVFSYAGQAARATLSLASFPPSSGGGAGARVTAFFYRA